MSNHTENAIQIGNINIIELSSWPGFLPTCDTAQLLASDHGLQVKKSM